jgi:hypothetical protein
MRTANLHDVAYDVIVGHLKELLGDRETLDHPARDELREYLNVAIHGVVKAHRENGRMWDVSSDFGTSIQ